MEKKSRMQPTHLSLKNKYITYCSKLSFGKISPCSYLNIVTMNIISYDTKITKKNVCYSRKYDFIKLF